MSTTVKAWLSLLLLVLAGYFGYSTWRVVQARQSNAGPQPNKQAEFHFQIEPFTLTDQQGQPFDTAQLEGKVWVASFFFTECAGACINLNNNIAALQKELPDVPVHFVSISVDPKKDTPEELTTYAAHYNADPQRWTFLTGTPEQIEHVAQGLFKVSSARLTHSDRLVLVGPNMQTIGYYQSSLGAEMAMLKNKLKSLALSSSDTDTQVEPQTEATTVSSAD